MTESAKVYAHCRRRLSSRTPGRESSGRAGGLVIRAKCAPFFRRILYGLDPASPLLRNFAEGSCPAGRHYCRIMPNGDVTACPYMPVVAGNLRRTPFGDLWRGAASSMTCAGERWAAAVDPVSSPESAVDAAVAPTPLLATIWRRIRPAPTSRGPTVVASLSFRPTKRSGCAPRPPSPGRPMRKRGSSRCRGSLGGWSWRGWNATRVNVASRSSPPS